MKNCNRILAALALAAAALGASAQTWPTKPIRILTPAPPGGTTDFLARLFTQNRFGQPIIVEAKPGASGNIATDVVAKSAPDGHTLLLGAPGSLAINISLFKKLPFDPQKDLAPIVLVASLPLLVAVHPSVPAANIRELIALLKANPEKYSYGTPGPGTPQHLSTEMFKSMTGTQIQHVPYKGSGPVVNDLLGGQIQVAFEAVVSLQPHVEAGKLRALAVTGAERSSSMPKIPTVAESGVPGFEASAWYGVVGPAGIPGETVSRLNSEMRRILDQPETKARLAAIGSGPVHGSAENFGAFIRAETVKWAKVIKESGAKADD
jgi:tripartite-type tricarboxylate transporter receptor subunit TctC